MSKARIGIIGKNFQGDLAHRGDEDWHVDFIITHPDGNTLSGGYTVQAPADATDDVLAKGVMDWQGIADWEIGFPDPLVD